MSKYPNIRNTQIVKLQMAGFIFLVLLIASASVYSINRPVYKVLLTQRGFTQFLQYDMETPPIREFTFCIWLRFFDLSYEQSIFTYVANSNNRVVRLWVDTGGQYIKISLNGRRASPVPVDITKNTWRLICISYQSDFGTWALYLDGQLVSCEATPSLFGNVLPAGGSVIIGYGTTENGIRSGFEGEAFGANMILISTIQRNYTISKDPQYQQKHSSKTKISGENNFKYMIFENLSDDVLTESTMPPVLYNSSRSFIKIKTPLSGKDHDVGLIDINQRRTTMTDPSKEKKLINFDISSKNNMRKSEDVIHFSNSENKIGNINFGSKTGYRDKFSNIGNEDFPNPSEFEVPPPLVSFEDYIRANTKIPKPINRSFFENKEYKKVKPYLAESTISQLYKHKLPDTDIPPPPNKKVKVYGQWTSSQFANSVLNYLKRFNNEYNDQLRVPPTIQLTKTIDTFPYASDFKVTKVHPPIEFQRKNIIDINKRVGKYPQINIEILQDDLRSQIMKSHAKTQPRNIEINHRGHMKNVKEHRNYRNIDNQLSSNEDHDAKILNLPPFATNINTGLKNNSPQFDLYKSNSVTTMLPFIKTSEYFIAKDDSKNKMYTRSLSSDNEWHNVKTFNNFYSPRPFSVEEENADIGDTKIFEVSKRNSSIKIKYIPENHKIVKYLDDSAILDARTLAMEISNLSNFNTFSNHSILKYNQGFLPTKNTLKKNKNKSVSIGVQNIGDKKELNEVNFNKNVKIGNALNERFIIGINEEQNKQSFIGGNEKIPDVGRYRSDIDKNDEKVPPSLGPRICKSVELNSHQFYVQPDGSVDVTHIWSPIKEKNLGVHFILQNYKKCSLEESTFQRNPLLLINWNKTPVRLFGGASPKKTTDLCGFF